MTGAFVGADPTIGVSYTPIGQGSIDARDVVDLPDGSSFNIATVSVGDQSLPFVSDVVPAGASAFHVVQVDRTSMQVIGSSTIVMSEPGGASAMTSLLQSPATGIGENTIWVIARIHPVVSDSADGDFVFLAQAMSRVGASFTTVNRLGLPAFGNEGSVSCPASTLGDYALIGWSVPVLPVAPLSEPPVLESSGPKQCLSRGPEAATTLTVAASAVLAPNQRGFYTPQSWGSRSGTAGLQAAVLRESDAGWPAVVGGGTTPTAAQAAAYADLSSYATSASTEDIRSQYRDAVQNLVTGQSDWTTQLTDAPYAAGAGYSQADFDAVRAELLVEVGQVGAIASYQQQMTELYEVVAGADAAKITDAYTEVDTSIGSPTADRASIADIVGGVGSIADDIAQFIPGFDLVGAAVGAVSEGAALAIQFTGAAGGKYQTAIAGLTTTWGDLEDAIPNLYGQQTTALNATVSLAAVDSTRLARFAAAVTPFNAALGTQFQLTDIEDGYVRSASRTYYTAFLNQNYLVYTKWAYYSPQSILHAAPTSEPYPYTRPGDGISLHSIVCFESGTCGAESADPTNYFVFLQGPNPALTTSNGAPTLV